MLSANKFKITNREFMEYDRRAIVSSAGKANYKLADQIMTISRNEGIAHTYTIKMVEPLTQARYDQLILPKITELMARTRDLNVAWDATADIEAVMRILSEFEGFARAIRFIPVCDFRAVERGMQAYPSPQPLQNAGNPLNILPEHGPTLPFTQTVINNGLLRYGPPDQETWELAEIPESYMAFGDRAKVRADYANIILDYLLAFTLGRMFPGVTFCARDPQLAPTFNPAAGPGMAGLGIPGVAITDPIPVPGLNNDLITLLDQWTERVRAELDVLPLREQARNPLASQYIASAEYTVLRNDMLTWCQHSANNAIIVRDMQVFPATRTFIAAGTNTPAIESTFGPAGQAAVMPRANARSLILHICEVAETLTDIFKVKLEVPRAGAVRPMHADYVAEVFNSLRVFHGYVGDERYAMPLCRQYRMSSRIPGRFVLTAEPVFWRTEYVAPGNGTITLPGGTVNMIAPADLTQYVLPGPFPINLNGPVTRRQSARLSGQAQCLNTSPANSRNFKYSSAVRTVRGADSHVMVEDLTLPGDAITQEDFLEAYTIIQDRMTAESYLGGDFRPWRNNATTGQYMATPLAQLTYLINRSVAAQRYNVRGVMFPLSLDVIEQGAINCRYINTDFQVKITNPAEELAYSPDVIFFYDEEMQDRLDIQVPEPADWAGSPWAARL